MSAGRTRRGSRSAFFELVPLRAALVFFAAVFFVFAPVNELLTSSLGQQRPVAASLLMAFLSGAAAVCWAATFTVSRAFAPGIVLFTAGVVALSGPFARPVLGMQPAPPTVAGLAIVGAIVLGYVLFVVFINGQGRTTLRLLTEMALAHRIHASLVPALEHSDGRFEVDGLSSASTEMGGDLVDLVDHGPTTDLVLADVSGHGVKAGVVMGMVKSALRMGLRQDRGLPRLASDLNEVLDQTTSPEMYATMVLLRLHLAERRPNGAGRRIPPVGGALGAHLRRGRLRCPSCQGRMRLLAVIKEPASIARYLAAVGEASEVPRRSPGRGPPYWKSQVLRRQVLEDEQDCGSHGDGADEAA